MSYLNSPKRCSTRVMKIHVQTKMLTWHFIADMIRIYLIQNFIIIVFLLPNKINQNKFKEFKFTNSGSIIGLTSQKIYNGNSLGHKHEPRAEASQSTKMYLQIYDWTIFLSSLLFLFQRLSRYLLLHQDLCKSFIIKMIGMSSFCI